MSLSGGQASPLLAAASLTVDGLGINPPGKQTEPKASRPGSPARVVSELTAVKGPGQRQDEPGREFLLPHLYDKDTGEEKQFSRENWKPAPLFRTTDQQHCRTPLPQGEV